MFFFTDKQNPSFKNKTMCHSYAQSAKNVLTYKNLLTEILI